jgi:hypothetical protein
MTFELEKNWSNGVLDSYDSFNYEVIAVINIYYHRKISCKNLIFMYDICSESILI